MQFGPPDDGLKLTETYVGESYILLLKFDSESAFRWSNFFFFYGSTALYGPGPPRFVEASRSHTLDTPQSVGLPWTRDQLVAETST
jgi:hypothetical protein